MMVITLSNIWGGKIPINCNFEKMSFLERQHGEHGNAAGEENPRMRHSRRSPAAGLIQIEFSSLQPPALPVLNSERDGGASSATMPGLSYKESLGRLRTLSCWPSTPRSPARCWQTHGRWAAGGRRTDPRNTPRALLTWAAVPAELGSQLPSHGIQGQLPARGMSDGREASQALPAAGAPQWTLHGKLKPKIDFTECYPSDKSWINYPSRDINHLFPLSICVKTLC